MLQAYVFPTLLGLSVAVASSAVRSDHVADTGEALAREIESLRKEAADHASALGVEVSGRAAGLLRRAEEALAADRWPAAVAPFAQAFRDVREVAFLAATNGPDGPEDSDGLEAFDALWRAQRGEFEALAPNPPTRVESTPRAAVLRALEDRASARAWRYYASSRAYADAAGAGAGRHYLAPGRASAELADVLRAIPGVARGERDTGELPGLEAMLDRLEHELSELFRPPSSQTDHAAFIELSSALEFARELHADGARAGGLFQALEVRRALELFTTDGIALPSLNRLDELLIAREERASRSEHDASIATAFLHDATLALERVSGGDDGATREAAAILGPVMADYFAVVDGGGDAASLAGGDAPAPVTVTLVRWPFT